MYRSRIRATALALAVLVGVSPMASASMALGDELHSGTVALAPGTEFTTQTLWSNSRSDLRTERYLTYNPADGVYPIVYYGDRVLSKYSLTDMSKALESRGLRVVGGINGDFFDMSTGNALGVLISDGVLRTTDGAHYAIGFLEDGTAFIGQPTLSVTATFSGATMRVTDVNKTRTADDGTHEGGLYLYTDEYSRTTQHTSPGYDVILTPITEDVGSTVEVDLDVTDEEDMEDASSEESGSDAQEEDTDSRSETEPSSDQEEISDSQDLDGSAPASGTADVSEVTGPLVLSDQLRVGGRVTCRVEEVLESTGSIEIPKGKMILTVNQQNNEWLLGMVQGLQPGDQVDIDVKASDERWNDVVTALGGYYKIVTNGEVGPDTDNTANPRSAIGIKEDGSVVFYTIDGHQSGYSVGATLTQVAQRLIELGCVEAVGLDGGGSTTMVATMPDQDAAQLVNQPSGGTQRAVTNGIFLVSELEPTEELDHYYVTPYDSIVLSGTQVALTATPVDTAGYAFSDDREITWSISNGDGLVDADGVFTAGSESGATQITASSNRAEGSATVTVVKTPDSISLTNEETGAPVTSLSLDPLQTVDLKATSVYRSITLASQDSCYTWTAEPAIGTIDENGVFTAAGSSVTGNLTVSAGGAYITIPVTVSGQIAELDSFETEEGVAALGSTEHAAVNVERSADLARYGNASVRVDYDASAGSASLTSALTIPEGARYLALWVYGDGSGNALTASVTDAEGTLSDVALTTLDFTGWQQIVAPLPDGAASLQSLTITYDGGEKPIGTLYLDQFTTANEELTDTTAPTVTTQLTGRSLTAYVSDNVDRSFSQSAVSLTYDGEPLSFTWDEASGALTASLPADDGIFHRVTVTAVDQSGNIGRSSIDLLPEALTGDPDDAEVPAAASPFADMTSHWAGLYTTALYHLGVVNGVQSGDQYLFQPENDITRAEFSLMVARWMGLDLESYADVALPFSDAGSIPSWALNGIKAMYAEGIVRGSLDNGVLLCNANSSISRAEAMTILGRIQSKGYPQQALEFTDADTVPSWSLSYVESMASQGIISGYDGLLRPNDPVKRGEVAKMLCYMF